MTEKAFDDISSAIFQLRKAFLQNGLKPPTSLELGSPEDGYKFMHALPKDMLKNQPRMGVDQNNPEWVCNLVGLEIRRPAEWRRDINGKRVLHEPELYSPPFKK